MSRDEMEWEDTTEPAVYVNDNPGFNGGLSEAEVTIIIAALNNDFLRIRDLQGVTVADKRRMRKMRSSIIQRLQDSI